MANRRSRAESMGRLAAAYGMHQLRRAAPGRRPAGLEKALRLYGPEHIEPLTEDERRLLPAMSRCINCGICALVAGRLGSAHLPDLSTAYLRPLPRLPDTARDLPPGGPQDPPQGSSPDLQAAAAACPVGVPLPALAAIVRRLARA